MQLVIIYGIIQKQYTYFIYWEKNKYYNSETVDSLFKNTPLEIFVSKFLYFLTIISKDVPDILNGTNNITVVTFIPNSE